MCCDRQQRCACIIYRVWSYEPHWKCYHERAMPKRKYQSIALSSSTMAQWQYLLAATSQNPPKHNFKIYIMLLETSSFLQEICYILFWYSFLQSLVLSRISAALAKHNTHITFCFVWKADLHLIMNRDNIIYITCWQQWWMTFIVNRYKVIYINIKYCHWK